MGRLEILAPAGNADMLKAAVFGGADAVYLGLTGFNARRTAGASSAGALLSASAAGASEALCAGADFIAVHDGARPLILPEQVDEMVRLGRQTTQRC